MNMKRILNLGLFYLSYQLKLVGVPHKPFFFWIEPTNICNLKCKNCPQARGIKGEKGFMSIELFRRITEEAKELNPMLTTLHLSGEPLLHKQIHQLVRVAKDAGLIVSFASNGALLDEVKAKQIIGSGLDAIKFDFSPDREEFEIVKTGADWEIILENITNFLKLKKERQLVKPIVTIRHLTLNTDKTGIEEDFKRLKDMFIDYPVNIVPYELHNWSGEYAEQDDICKFSRTETNYYPCSHLWTSFTIRWNGTVVPCCRDLNGEYIVGDITAQSIKEIWNGRRLVQLREKLKGRRFKDVYLCRSCSKLWEGKKPLHLLIEHVMKKGPRVKKDIMR